MKPRPTPSPTREPSYPWPTCQPTTMVPTKQPSSIPSDSPSLQPTALPSVSPTISPSVAPSSLPSTQPTTVSPTMYPSESPPTSPTASPTYPNAEYCIEKVKLHFASAVLAGCIAICTLGIFIKRRSTGNMVSPTIFSPKTFSPINLLIERIGVQSGPVETSMISMEDLAIGRVQVRELEGIPDCEVKRIDMTPI